VRASHLSHLERLLSDFSRVEALVASQGRPFSPPLDKLLPLFSLYTAAGAGESARGAPLAASMLRVALPGGGAGAAPPLLALAATDSGARFVFIAAALCRALLRAHEHRAAPLICALVDPAALARAGAPRAPELAARVARGVLAGGAFLGAVARLRGSTEGALRGGGGGCAGGGAGGEEGAAGYGAQPLAGALLKVALLAAAPREEGGAAPAPTPEQLLVVREVFTLPLIASDPATAPLLRACAAAGEGGAWGGVLRAAAALAPALAPAPAALLLGNLACAACALAAGAPLGGPTVRALSALLAAAPLALYALGRARHAAGAVEGAMAVEGGGGEEGIGEWEGEEEEEEEVGGAAVDRSPAAALARARRRTLCAVARALSAGDVTLAAVGEAVEGALPPPPLAWGAEAGAGAGEHLFAKRAKTGSAAAEGGGGGGAPTTASDGGRAALLLLGHPAVQQQVGCLLSPVLVRSLVAAAEGSAGAYDGFSLLVSLRERASLCERLVFSRSQEGGLLVARAAVGWGGLVEVSGGDGGFAGLQLPGGRLGALWGALMACCGGNPGHAMFAEDAPACGVVDALRFCFQSVAAARGRVEEEEKEKKGERGEETGGGGGGGARAAPLAHALLRFLRGLLYRLCWSSAGARELLSRRLPAALRLLVDAAAAFNALYERHTRREDVEGGSFAADADFLFPPIPPRELTPEVVMGLATVEAEDEGERAPGEGGGGGGGGGGDAPALLGGAPPSTHSALTARLRAARVMLLLTTLPQTVPFLTRAHLFKRLTDEAKRARVPWENRARVAVQRGHLVEDAMGAFQGLLQRGSSLRNEFSLEFFDVAGVKEEGIDGGGLTKSFIDEVVKVAFNPAQGLFCTTADNLAYPNPFSAAAVRALVAAAERLEEGPRALVAAAERLEEGPPPLLPPPPPPPPLPFHVQQMDAGFGAGLGGVLQHLLGGGDGEGGSSDEEGEGEGPAGAAVAALEARRRLVRACDHLARFEFLGQLLGKALYENILVEPRFAHFVLLRLLGRAPGVEDLPSLDRGVAAGLSKLLATARRVREARARDPAAPDEVDAMGLSLSVLDVGPGGSAAEVDLVPGGRAIAVTANNAERYAALFAHHRLNTQIARQVRAFLRGFRELVPLPWLHMFAPHELQQLLSGEEVLDVGAVISDLRTNVNLHAPFDMADPYILSFWAVLGTFSPAELRKFLGFVTSVPRPPLLGFASLSPRFGIKPLTPSDNAPLPVASTCFNMLYLRAFPHHAR
jgi:hypothetical protein